MYYLLIIAGGLMTMDTIWLSTVCNGNLGTALPAIMGVPLLLIGLFRGFSYSGSAPLRGISQRCCS